MALAGLDLDAALAAHLVVGTDLTDVVLVPQVIIQRRRFVHLCRPEIYISCAFFTRKMGNFTV